VSLTLDVLFGVGSLMLIVAGLFLIFGMLHVINLAHAGLMAVGVYAQVSFRGHGIPFWPAVLLSALVAGAAGAVIEFVVIRRLYARPLDTILLALGRYRPWARERMVYRALVVLAVGGRARPR